MRMRYPRTRTVAVLAASSAALVALAVPAGGLAGRPVDNEHSVFNTGPYADNWCGIDGISVTRGTEQYRQDASGAFIDNLNATTVFTATGSGKSMTIQQSGVGTGYWIDNPDGSSTLYGTVSGLGPKFTLPTRRVIVDTGTTGYEVFFDANGNFAGFAILYHHGPQPGACDAIVEALG
jgi:hypothetical protein